MYLFKTDYFGFTEDEIHLMRSHFPYKKMPLTEITKIVVKKGIATKHPIRVFIFAMSFLASSIWLIFWGWLEVVPLSMKGGQMIGNARGFAALITGTGFIMSMGLFALYQLLIRKTVLYVEFSNGTHELLSLKRIKRNNQLHELINYLMDKFPPQVFQFEKHSAIQKHISFQDIE